MGHFQEWWERENMKLLIKGYRVSTQESEKALQRDGDGGCSTENELNATELFTLICYVSCTKKEKKNSKRQILFFLFTGKKSNPPGGKSLVQGYTGLSQQPRSRITASESKGKPGLPQPQGR